ncbi:MAG TPA: hypothetical protein VNU24_05645 [Solirubrobacteraceae bacterium]|nr:hypothetical protein [Solirubrobacteraceae bacterium]
MMPKARANPVALLAGIDGKTGEDRHRDWKVLRESFAGLGRRFVMIEMPGEERVIAVHPVAARHRSNEAQVAEYA